MLTLNWIGKDAVLNHHKEVPFHLLRCDPKRSVGDESGNLLVQGDNALTITKSITLVQLWMKFLEVKTSLLQLFGKKIFTPKGSARHLSENHEFILVYAQNKNIWTRNLRLKVT